MAKYILRRLISCLLVVIAASIVIFTIMYFVPGDPVRIMLGETATMEQIEAKRQELGLNGSYIERLGTFLYNTFIRFDLGVSYATGLPFTQELLSRLPRTLGMGVASIILSVLVSLPMGIWAALHNGHWQDKLSIFIAIFCQSMPNFWLALLLLMLFSVRLGWLPVFGIGTWKHYVLPVIAGAVGSIGMKTRQMRSGMLDVIKSDFVVTARAKGLEEGKVVRKHMLPNALIPVITVIGTHFANTIAGAVLIENIFSIPGVGQYLLSAVNSRDLPIVQGGVVFLSAAISLIMLMVDLVYALIDPRIKAQYAGKGG